ncbi:770_t:CDS:2, partial [Ambispora gerdemannii]
MELESAATLVASETNQHNGGSTAAPSLAPVFEPIHLQDHLDKLLPLVLGAESSELKASLWSAPETSEKLRQDQSSVTYTYSITQEITYQQNHVASVALIKLVPSLDPIRSLQLQIQLINLPGPASAESGSAALSPYETLHSTIHLVVGPFFEAYVNAKGGSGDGVVSTGRAKQDDSKMGIPMAKKKIAELELSLRHLQQNVEIPEISLSIHPVVQKAAKQENRSVNVDMIDQSHLEDSGLLNKLQSDVNGWIKEIQKVTKLSRDPSS